ncbi:hypothetical protein [Globicatella sanguinis]|uniref:Adenylate kinase and related kinases n=1 Tax=Globicatella sulfidifaciens DSM 15739 TaxID=1121925 RepID=A0A1T4MNC8_9LACT|nr:hypothetical protein [Globicatella sanguinis]WIK67535.1 hypothetical protein CYJ72_005615 [Globicatella sanguinis]WKT56940.1 hypothetical protein Q3C38_05615 [Globicatella sanguinis]SJZ68381.1 Adenylate kinase and related kinases [Globicatella sulfidifaciens DSM 15739]
MTLVLLGLPGAGKGTQDKRIAEEYHLTAIQLVKCYEKQPRERYIRTQSARIYE